MERISIESLLSDERVEPYLKFHDNNFERAIEHYKANIEISEAFYPMISILEVALRNKIDYQLKRKFGEENWFDNSDFINIVSGYQITIISETKRKILTEKKQISHGRIIAELSFGFWTSLFDSKFESTLWKSLRLAFPNCPKTIRKRKTMSAKFNGIRKLRNRIFHHESIAWDMDVLKNYEKELCEGINWLDRDLLKWVSDIFRLDSVFKSQGEIFNK